MIYITTKFIDSSNKIKMTVVLVLIDHLSCNNAMHYFSRQPKRVKRQKVSLLKKNSVTLLTEYFVHISFYCCLSLSLFHIHTHGETKTCLNSSLCVQKKKKTQCLNSFGIKFVLNKSTDLPVRRRMSYREH